MARTFTLPCPGMAGVACVRAAESGDGRCADDGGNAFDAGFRCFSMANRLRWDDNERCAGSCANVPLPRNRPFVSVAYS